MSPVPESVPQRRVQQREVDYDGRHPSSRLGMKGANGSIMDGSGGENEINKKYSTKEATAVLKRPVADNISYVGVGFLYRAEMCM